MSIYTCPVFYYTIEMIKTKHNHVRLVDRGYVYEDEFT